MPCCDCTSSGKFRVPELPEVEVVRLGLEPLLVGARIAGVEVGDGRALKRHRALLEAGSSAPGHGVTLDAGTKDLRASDFETRLAGRKIHGISRRGKFLWAPLDAGPHHRENETLVAHLGMSGQLLIRSHEAPDDKHVRIRLWIDSPARPNTRVDFVDQRLFGSLAIDTLTTDLHVPESARHIASDPLEREFDERAWAVLVRSRSTAIKTLLLNQNIISGVGNIYADEALWAARIHPQTPANRISAAKLVELIENVRRVFHRALAEGGTSFDAQYVNVNGESGYFAHSLNVYGRQGQPCPRCGTAITRVPFGGRSSHFCTRCQRAKSA